MSGDSKVKAGVNRRVFINRSVAGAGGAVVLSNAANWPAWAESPAFEGVNQRMGRLARDPETGQVWQSLLRLDTTVEEVPTEWGPTRVTRVTDAVVAGEFGGKDMIDVSAGRDDFKLDPRLDARAGKACVVWSACDPATRQWRVYASLFAGSWSKPIEIAGGGRPALHPQVALDPATGTAWIAYEDWADGSIRLTSFDGAAASDPIIISETGKNYRPQLIVTRKDGKYGGRLAVVWDSYRDLQYDIYLRLLTTGGELGEEMRVTRCARWDSMADVIEDRDGNLWVAWVRASNELSQLNAMRNVHVRFWDGQTWRFPHDPKVLYEGDEHINSTISGMGAAEHRELLRALKDERREPGDGRITAYTVCWFPQLQVDDRNRVYVFYRESDPVIFALYSHLNYRCYAGDTWSKPKRLKLGRGANITHMLWEFSTVIDEGRVRAVWDDSFITRGKQVSRTRTIALPSQSGDLFHPQGDAHEEKMHDGWPLRETMRPAPEIDIDGENHVLLFGDTHAHSWTSDGADPADHYYHFARDYARLDFFGLSDHDFRICQTPGLEAYVSFLPRAFTEPDFICFQGYEFTSQAKGHRCVLFEGDDRPTYPDNVYLDGKGDKVNSVGSLYHFLHRFGAAPDSRVLVTSHNMFNIGNDFSEYDESLEPVYDVMSLHVAAEKPLADYIAAGVVDKRATSGVSALMNVGRMITGDRTKRDLANQWYMCWKECLAGALPLGAYGASDTHAVNGLGWITAGVWTKGNTRKEIFDALFARRCLAIDNQARNFEIFNTFPFLERRVYDKPVMRMDVRFWLDDRFMGAKAAVAGPPTARVYARGSDPADPVRRIVFVKDGVEVHTAVGFPGGPAEASWTDESFTGGRHYYYARIEFASNNMAYSSPVFANYGG